MADIDVQLPFSMQFQQRTFWCWAATARCVSHSYDSHSPWTQCGIAKAELGRSSCSNCNEPWFLNSSLTRTGNLSREQSGSILWSKVKSEILAGRIVCAWNGWDGGGGHFVSIYGVAKTGGTMWLHIYDSFEDYGEAIIKYSDFKRNYENIGPWGYTFFTDKIQSSS